MKYLHAFLHTSQA